MNSLQYKGATITTYAIILFEGALNSIIVACMFFLSTHFNRTNAEISYLILAKSIGTLLLLYRSGRLSDKLGRQLVLAAGVVLFIIFLLGLSLSKNFYLAIVFSFVGGLAHGLCDAPALSALFDIFPKNTGPALSVSQIFFSGGAALSTFLAGVFIRYGWQWQIIFFALIGYGILVLIMAWFSKYPHILGNQAKQMSSSFHSGPKIGVEGLLIAVIVFCYSASYMMMGTWLPSFALEAKHYSESLSMYVLTSFQIGGIVGALIFSQILRRHHPTRFMIINPLLSLVGLILILGISTPIILLPVVFVTGMFLGVYFSFCVNVAGELFSHHSGGAAGAIATSSSLGGMLFVFISGKIYPLWGFNPVFYLCMALLLVTFGLSVVLRKAYLRLLKP